MSQLVRLRLVLLVSTAVTVLLGLVVIVTQRAASDRSPNADAVGDFGMAPAWTLSDQIGRPVSSSTFQGKIIVADFIYTHCTDICPQLSLQMQTLRDRLQTEGMLGGDVQLLSFTTDPARDTPGVLHAYALRYRADPENWRFLTGPEGQLVPLIVEGFHLGVQALPPARQKSDESHTGTMHAASYEVMHSGSFVLIDRRGHIRAYYDGQTLDPDRVIRDIRGLMRDS